MTRAPAQGGGPGCADWCMQVPEGNRPQFRQCKGCDVMGDDIRSRKVDTTVEASDDGALAETVNTP